MRPLIRILFKSLRVLLGPFMLFWELLTRPKGLVRVEAEQEKVDRACQSLALYQFKTCPFCIKVRQELMRLSLNIQTYDAQHDTHIRNELLSGGGEIKVPCLKITDDSGKSQWIYESEKIIGYLRNRFSDVSVA